MEEMYKKVVSIGEVNHWAQRGYEVVEMAITDTEEGIIVIYLMKKT